MKSIGSVMVLAASLTVTGFIGVALAADEAPDKLISGVSTDALNSAKADKEIRTGARKHVLDLVESRITDIC